MSSPAPKYFKAWIIFFLIATVGGFILGAIIGGVMGFGLGMAGVGVGMIQVICGAAGFLIGIPLSYFTFRWSVAEFIVKDLTATPSVPATPSAEPPRV